MIIKKFELNIFIEYKYLYLSIKVLFLLIKGTNAFYH
jgi:hypothetical protein